ncbi:unnamed protein product [Rhizophagus irregularis]|nr:unnamed protein product [Rhizophagus irregularis]
MFRPIVTKYLSETKFLFWNTQNQNVGYIQIPSIILRIITDFEKSFSTAEVKEFVDKLREEQEERGFDTACKINATSASAVKALECHRMNHTRINELNNDEHEEGGSSRRFSLRTRPRINYAESLYSSKEETEPTYKMQQKKVKGQSLQSKAEGIIQVNRSMPVRDEGMNVSKSNDSPKTPPLRPRQTTITTPHKPTLSELSIQYLAKHISVDVNGQCVIMKTDQVDTIPEAIRGWLVTALMSEKDVCETILYDFFSMTSENTLDRNIGERKYISSTLNKVDGIGVKVASNKEIVFIEVSGGLENAILKHIKEDTEKLIKEVMFGLVSLLRDYLDKSAENAKNLRTFMVQCIGDRVTLILGVFELLYALISGLINQTRELKKLMLSKSVDNNLSVRDWIWVPNSTETWEAIEIIYEDIDYNSFDL